jgi:hypothetical protein
LFGKIYRDSFALERCGIGLFEARDDFSGERDVETSEELLATRRLRTQYYIKS